MSQGGERGAWCQDRGRTAIQAPPTTSFDAMPRIPDLLNEAFPDRYSVYRWIPNRGMATVYLSRDLMHQCRVAIEVPGPELAAALRDPRVAVGAWRALTVGPSGRRGSGARPAPRDIWLPRPRAVGEERRR